MRRASTARRIRPPSSGNAGSRFTSEEAGIDPEKAGDEVERCKQWRETKRVGCAHCEQNSCRYARQNRIYQRPGQRDGYLFAQIARAFFLRAGIAHGQPADGQQHKTFNGKSLAR